MRWTKAFGLSSIVAVAAMAIVGISAADAQGEVVLCKALETLCATGNIWPSGTEISALASSPKLEGAWPIVCEDVVIKGKTTAKAGPSLPVSLTYLEFGKLPKPELGAGCLGCSNLKTEIHTSSFLPFAAKFTVSGKDAFQLLIDNAKINMLCGSIKCVYSKSIESKTITHSAQHKEDQNANNLPSIPIEVWLETLEDTSGTGFCGIKIHLTTVYVVTGASFGGESGLAWPSLEGPLEDPDEVTLCKKLEKLCAEGNLWPSGTEISALAQSPKFKGVLPVECEDSVVGGKTQEEVGSPLKIEITNIEFGKLPKPELGSGCKGCPFGLKTEVHTKPFLPFAAQLKVSGEDEFKLLFSNFKLTVLCGSISCVFSGHLESKIVAHTGKHPEDPDATNLPVMNFEAPLTVLEDTSGIGACGKSTTWNTSYTVFSAHSGADTGLAWPSLDKKI